MDIKHKIILLVAAILIALLLTAVWWIYWRSPPETAEVLVWQNGDTSYKFNDKAWLRSVSGKGHNIEYKFNSSGSRVEKSIAGEAVERYYWLEGNKPLSITDPNDQVIYLFEYDEDSHRVPTAFKYSGQTFRIIYDRTRSPRVIQDMAGNLVKAMSYNESGAIVKDSNPDFKFPLGFAGGLFDFDTGLLHFKQGEYDPENGRWIAKRAPIDIVENLRQLARVEKEQVYKCAYNGGQFPHAFLCSGYRCGGLHADSTEDYFNGSGRFSNNTHYFNQNICQLLQPKGSACDAAEFSRCVEQAILPHAGEYFDGFRRNCYHAVDEIHISCSRQACE